MDEIKEALQFMADTLNKRKEQEHALKTQNTAEVSSTTAAEPEGNAAPGAGGNEDSSEHNAGSFIVKTALKYMEENYTQKITLAERPYWEKLFRTFKPHPDRRGQEAVKGPVSEDRRYLGRGGIHGCGAFFQGF